MSSYTIHNSQPMFVDVDLLLMRLLFHLVEIRCMFFFSFSLSLSCSLVLGYFHRFLNSMLFSIYNKRYGMASFTIAVQMRYWQFNDCSFMSRSMQYVTKRTHLTFTIKIGFSLIFTCSANFAEISLIAIVWAIKLLAIIERLFLLFLSLVLCLCHSMDGIHPALFQNVILNSSEYNLDNSIFRWKTLRKFKHLLCV